MQRKAPKFDRALIVSQTNRAAEIVAAAIKRAHDIVNDTDAAARLEAQLCKACHYRSPGLAGAAVTHQPCACCGTDQVYGSTKTDVLCVDCAQAHALCKHCGGDLELRTERSDWPAEAASK